MALEIFTFVAPVVEGNKLGYLVNYTIENTDTFPKSKRARPKVSVAAECDRIGTPRSFLKVRRLPGPNAYTSLVVGCTKYPSRS